MEKPPGVARAISEAIKSFGNAGRSFHGPSMKAAGAVLDARLEIVKLTGHVNPFGVAFTSGATESLNLAIRSLISPGDHVITSELEHNSVLRPLYKTGCELSYIRCDGGGRLVMDNLDSLVRPNTRFVVCTHGSNLFGTITDTATLCDFGKRHGLVSILDASQTMGCTEITGDMADIICFTGHKALFGPQGTGGIIVSGDLDFRLTKTGGSGGDGFAPHQNMEMPDIFEAGTHNAHGLAGLTRGVAYVNGIGVAKIKSHGNRLLREFLNGIDGIPGLILYGDGTADDARLPIVALNVGSLSADELARKLWEDYEIATRAGIHCAPLAHKRFGTEGRGMVRFSFGFFNTSGEIEIAVNALREIAKNE